MPCLTRLRIDSDHLDADELSAYAENALPAAARARYTEHLADCSRCRELVVQLSSSVPVSWLRRDCKSSSAFRAAESFLASFFSPMVLRYAVPALGLIVVAAIGFVVFRRIDLQSVAQSERKLRSQPASHVEPTVSNPRHSKSRRPKNLDQQRRVRLTATTVNRSNRGSAPAVQALRRRAVTSTRRKDRRPLQRRPSSNQLRMRRRATATSSNACCDR